MDALNRVAAAINNGFAYLKDNAWPIVFMVALWFYLKPRGMYMNIFPGTLVVSWGRFLEWIWIATPVSHNSSPPNALYQTTVVSAMETVKAERSPQKVKDYDLDLRRVRQLQQMQAEQEAKIKAKELQEKKAKQLLESEIKQPKSNHSSNVNTKKPADASKKSGAASSLTMNSFSTPSYRYVLFIWRLCRLLFV